MKKYFICIILILLISTLVVEYSCINKKSKKLVTYGRYWSGIKKGMDDVFIPGFKQKSGYDIEIFHYESSQALQKVRDDIKRGKKTASFIWIDLMDLPAYTSEDLLMDVTDLVAPFESKLPPAYVKAATVKNGKIIAVPYNLSADLMVYDSLNIKPEDLPDTYEQLLEWAKKNPDRFSYRGKDEHLSVFLVKLCYAFGALSEETNPAKIFDRSYNPKIVDVFEYLKKLYPYVRKPLYSDNNEINLALARGSIWLFSTIDSEIPRIRVTNGGTHIKVHPNFQLMGPTGKRYMVSGGWYWAIPKNSANPEGAREFIKYMSTIENFVESVGNFKTGDAYCGHFPIRYDAYELIPKETRIAWWDISNQEVIEEKIFPNFVNRPQVKYYYNISTLLQKVHDKIVINGEDINSTLDLAQKELDKYTGALSTSSAITDSTKK